MKKLNLILNELKVNLEKQLPGVVNKIILYGSYAKGNSHKDSDLDVLLIVNQTIDWKTKEIIYEVFNDLNIKHEVWLDANWLHTDELNTIRGKQPFIQNALAEGVAY